MSEFLDELRGEEGSKQRRAANIVCIATVLLGLTICYVGIWAMIVFGITTMFFVGFTAWSEEYDARLDTDEED